MDGYIGSMESPTEAELDALVDELFPLVREHWTGTGLFDPEGLEGSVRDYYVDYLDWLGIREATLPADRICIHADQPGPARLENRAQQGGGSALSVYLDTSVFRSQDIVKLALAHQFSHFFLAIHGHQSSADARYDHAPGERSESEAETRTEVAAFLLGFGKLMLNGACAYAELLDADDSVVPLGHLPVSALTHLYRSVNNRLEVTGDAADTGLTDAAIEALRVEPSEKKSDSTVGKKDAGKKKSKSKKDDQKKPTDEKDDADDKAAADAKESDSTVTKKAKKSKKDDDEK